MKTCIVTVKNKVKESGKINQVVPFVKYGVEDDPTGEYFPVTVGDFPACFVDLIDRTGEYFQASIGYNLETQLDV